MHPCCIWNLLMFSPSLFCETSAYLFAARVPQLLWPLLTSPPALHECTEISPGKSRFLPPIPAASTIQAPVALRTSYCCGYSSRLYSLICRFCSSVPDFAVPLPSLLPSPATSLRLAKSSGQPVPLQAGLPRRLRVFHPLEKSRSTHSAYP